MLELAAGPGSLGATWSQLVGPTGAVVVSDIAPGWSRSPVAETRRSATSRPQSSTPAAIDRPDGSFDVVACRMGLMFTPDPSVAFAEIARVLRPGGRLGALTWGGIEHNPWMTCVGMAAMANGLVRGGPPVGPGGIFSLGDPAELEALAKGAGLVDVAVDELAVTFRADTVNAHVERVGALAGPLATALQAATPDQLRAPSHCGRPRGPVSHRRRARAPRARAPGVRPTLTRLTTITEVTESLRVLPSMTRCPRGQ